MSAYMVFSHKVLDPETLNDNYLPKAVETLKKFGVEIVVVDQNFDVFEGNTDYNRLVILKFKSREAAMEWYNSPEYQEIVHLRTDSIDGIAMLADGFNPDEG